MYRSPEADVDPRAGRAVLLDVRDARVDYDEFTALRDVTFTVAAGTVFGLIGPNGAGKTTLLRAIAGLQPLTRGKITVCGHDVATHPREAAARRGYMPDLPPVYEDLSVLEFLEVFASAHRVEVSQRRARIEALVEQVKLTDKLHALAGGLSRGMRQRLFLAVTLLHEPDVILLDEPASGLDPNARAVLADILRSLGRSGRAVIVSSHILAELDEFCTEYAIVERGTMRAAGSVDKLAGRVGPERVLQIELARVDEGVMAIIASVLIEAGIVEPARIAGSTVSVAYSGGPDTRGALLRALVLADVPVCNFTEAREHIRDVYARLTTGETA
ncbi:MAG: ABC transporter ATP-binding protein [Deltaproteobacteria bacterium]